MHCCTRPQKLLCEPMATQIKTLQDRVDQLRAANIRPRSERLRQQSETALSAKLNDLQVHINAQLKVRQKICLKAWNEYTTRQIRRDFCLRIKQILKKSRQPTVADDGDDNDDEDGHGDGDVLRRTAETIILFCCSAHEFMNLSGSHKVVSDDEVFSDTASTGIPALTEHVHKITDAHCRHNLEHPIRMLGEFMAEVAGYPVHDQDVNMEPVQRNRSKNTPIVCHRRHVTGLYSRQSARWTRSFLA